MEKEILGRSADIRSDEGPDRWDAWATLYLEGRGPSDGEEGVEREFYGFGDDREGAEEMIEILIINYLKKKWKSERLRGQQG
ncbi:MAG: hypothetical protein ACE5IM_03610 [Nitrospinota bacterium]